MNSRRLLFTDFRHIACNDLAWVSADGEPLPLIAPPEPQVEARAVMGHVPRGIRIMAQPAGKVGPLDLPKGVNGFAAIVHEGGGYRAWRLQPTYAPGRDFGAYSTDAPGSAVLCHYESPDGFEWRETHRCEVDVEGQTAFDGFTVFADLSGAPGERYKAVYTACPPEAEWPAIWQEYLKLHPRYREDRIREDHVYAMYGAVSPDGLDWRPIPERLMVHFSDTDTSVYHDEWLGCYVMYTRLHPQGRRWIGRTESEDFRTWEPVTPLIQPKLDWAPSDDVYTNGRTAYPGSPEYHLMFPMVYHRLTQTSEVRMYSSPDGISWGEVPDGPVLTPGEPTEWDAEYIHAGKNLVPLGDGRVGVPYYGTSYPHKYPRWRGVLDAARMGWACWPEGRLGAVVAEELGEFWTVPVPIAGRRLLVNARTRRAGEVRVGIVGDPQRTVEKCTPISGDSLAHPVTWGATADLGVARGTNVVLHLQLRAADLFAIEWA